MRILISVILSLLMLSCVETPTSEPGNGITTYSSGVYVLCEGIWGSNNAELVFIDIETGSIERNYFEKVTGFKPGDLANDLMIRDSIAWIVMSGSQIIYKIDLSSGELINRIELEGNKQPRRLLLNDNYAYVTNLYANSITKIDRETGEIISDIICGSAPEGIAGNGELYIVANSGLGDFRKDEEGAGTAYIYNAGNDTKIAEIDDLPNADQVIYNESSGLFYISYRNLPSQEDSLGGIIEFDPITFTKLREWRADPFKIGISASGDSLYILTNSSFEYIDLRSSSSDIKPIIQNPNESDVWYTFALKPGTNEIWIGNARNYVVDGEILVYDLNNPYAPKSTYECGIIPNTIGFR